jgi:pseudaminic acid biosynthesis-associated methylase
MASETNPNDRSAEAVRLEALWAGEFGDQYVERNADAGAVRGPFWTGILELTSPLSALEVGCNVGANLRWLADGDRRVVGVDVNQGALAILEREVTGATGVEAPARSLPFADKEFDLTFTMGVLIHQPDESLGAVMDEMVRCSRRYVLVGEYHGAETEEVPYRGVDGALFRRDYGALFLERFPTLQMVDSGFLGREDGWDDVTWWLFDRGDE